MAVLGVAQDGGHPQAGCRRPCCEPAWTDADRAHRVACLGLVDPKTGGRWMMDATPDLPVQLRALQDLAPDPARPALEGIFLTHAHTGHYTGLVHLGPEAMAARAVPVYAMPRMRRFLRHHGPWDALVRGEHVVLHDLEDAVEVRLTAHLAVTPLTVPHRDEYSETVAFLVTGPSRRLLYVPDIASWDAWPTPIERILADVDVALVDGTFWSEAEVPARDVQAIGHPLVRDSVLRFAALPPAERRKLRFIHLNHTNPILDDASPEARVVRETGLGVAREGEHFAL